MEPGWSSYDSIAADYDRRAVPHLFARIARDLVELLRLPASGRVLDVGAGTGAVAQAARESGVSAAVIGVDPSLPMLQTARRKGLPQLVAGVVPGLPFRDSVFDRVTANFVLSHFASYQAALSDMVRVLRPGGALGATAWVSTPNEPNRLWQETAESFAGKGTLARAVAQALPWEERFSEPASLKVALEEAGVVRVFVEQRAYRTTISVADFLAMREIAVQGRFVRAALGASECERFREEAARVFQARFAGDVEYAREVHFAVGSKL